jgi:drug/metabolite transporter (DMT)-like permease
VSLGIALSLVVAVLFGAYLYSLKRYFAAYPSPVFVVLLYAVGFPLYLPMVAIGGGPLVPTTEPLLAMGLMVAVAALTAVALVSFFAAIRRGDVSYVSPIAKIVPVFVLPIEVLGLDVELSVIQIAGVVIATVAIYVANWQGGALLAPLRRAASSTAAQLALASAATFGVVDVGKRVMMQEMEIEPAMYLPVMFVAVALVLLPWALRCDWPEDWQADLPKFVVISAIVAYGNHAILVAFTELPASIVSPLVNLQAVVAVVLGGLLLQEQYFRTRLVAAALAVGGVAMISLG